VHRAADWQILGSGLPRRCNGDGSLILTVEEFSFSGTPRRSREARCRFWCHIRWLGCCLGG
jgi:hypothetical protein